MKKMPHPYYRSGCLIHWYWHISIANISYDILHIKHFLNTCFLKFATIDYGTSDSILLTLNPYYRINSRYIVIYFAYKKNNPYDRTTFRCDCGHFSKKFVVRETNQPKEKDKLTKKMKIRKSSQKRERIWKASPRVLRSAQSCDILQIKRWTVAQGLSTESRFY